ncbi:MAG: hypothetical protein ACERJ2_12715 [Filomicrobium sp.]
MAKFDVNLGQVASGSWQVTNGKIDARRNFRHKDHALAFARALAHSYQSDLYLLGPDGASCRQSRASLTYPVILE